jgi:Tfp pilus assembly protein PilF
MWAVVVLVSGWLLLSPPTAAQGVLRGSVTDSTDNPIEGVTVKMIPVSADLQTVTATSNKKGKFVFGLLRPATYQLIATMDGMRVYWAHANVAVPDDDSLWRFEEDLPPGTIMPNFAVTGTTEVTFQLKMKGDPGGPGEYGTGVPVSPTKAIVELIQRGEAAQAEEEVRRSLEANPDAPALHYLLGFLLRNTGDLEGAAAAADRALELDPAFEGIRVLKAKILEAQGDSEGAIAMYREELEIATSTQVQGEAYQGMATLLLSAGRLEEAKQVLEQLIVVSPDVAGAYQELANIYIREGNEEKAAEMLEQVAALGVQNPDILYNMGAERYNSGDLEAARGYFEQTLEADPAYTAAYLQLGFTCIGLDDREAAAQHLRKFLELSPEDDPNVATANAILQQITQ